MEKFDFFEVALGNNIFMKNLIIIIEKFCDNLMKINFQFMLKILNEIRPLTNKKETAHQDISDVLI